MRSGFCAAFIALVIAALPGNSALAHYLFIKLGAQAEAGRSAEVYFSERATAGDPRFTAKIAQTQLWMQAAPGEFSPLTVRAAADRLRAMVPAEGAVSVSGRCVYGVLQREVPFLLVHYPKAISGPPDALAALKPCGHTPLEILAKLRGDQIELQAIRDGKPLAKCKFTTVDEDLANEELTADDGGRATWRPGAPGQYAVYIRHDIHTEGTHDGKLYHETREFATLAFEWPLEHAKANPAAVKMFQDAVAARAAWKKFPGFSAEISGSVDGRRFAGQATVAADGSIKLKTDDDATADWVEDQLTSIVRHRQAPPNSDSPPVLYFADQDQTHPLGRLLTFVGGQFASSYRVRDDEIVVVNRKLGDLNMTITVLENERNVDGKLLPRAYTVQYWDAKTGQLARTESIQNRWTRVGNCDLPTELTVTTASDSGLSVRSLRFEKHKSP